MASRPGTQSRPFLKHMDMRRLSCGPGVSPWSGKGRTGGPLVRISARDQFDRVVAAEARENGYSSLTESLPTLGLTRYAEGEITDSLFLSAERAGVPAAVIVEFIRLFSFDVDFQREIWPGNRFEILFDRQMNADYGDLREGDVLYAKLVLRDRTLELTRYEDADGRTDYFNEEGKSVRKALNENAD